jgi:hypothetical protein
MSDYLQGIDNPLILTRWVGKYLKACSNLYSRTERCVDAPMLVPAPVPIVQMRDIDPRAF